ncbi:MAG: hypothetical protein ACTSVV_09805 [Promethearchaeota archaeon]
MGLTPEEINIRLNNLRRYPNPSDELKVIEKSLYPKKNKRLKSKSLYEKSQLLEKINLIEKKRNKNKEELNVAVNLLESLKNYSNQLKALYQISIGEKNSMISSKEYTQLMRHCEEVEKELNTYLDIPEITPEVEAIRNRINNSDDPEFIFEHVGVEQTNQEVLEYFLDLIKINPNVEQIKNEILKCKNLHDAQSVYYRLKNRIEEEESFKISSPIQESYNSRRFDLNRVKHEGWL